MESYICIKENSICHDLCDEIVAKFEKEEDKYEGLTTGGVQKHVKNTTDYIIPSDCPEWYKIYKCLLQELTRNIGEYLDTLTIRGDYYKNSQRLDGKFVFTPIHKDNIIFYNFMVQRYIKNEGKYIYHDDGTINFDKKEYRTITYIWYLNTVDEGGETVFWNDHKIKPEKGKLVLFPASWTFPHCGKIPISSNKYIITGWIYQKIN
jgi:hypothetical protein